MRITASFKITTIECISSVFVSCLDELKKHKPGIFLSSQAVTDIKTAFVEAVANANKHARELEQQQKIEGRFFLDDKVLGFDVYDHGKGFQIDAVPVPDLNDFAATGRGVFMIKQLGDVVQYKQNKNKNTLTFKRNLVGTESSKGLDLLYELSEAIIRHASLDEVYQMILERALKLFHVERASVLIYDEGLKALKMVASRGIDAGVQDKIRVRSGEGVSGYVFRHGRSLLIEDIESNRRGIEKKEHYKTRSFISAPMICSPLRLDERPVGVINLTDRVDGKKFSKKDLKLLSTIANQAMACLYIRGLVDEIKAAEILKQEMEQVRVIQSSYLPHQAPVIEGFDISGRCEMAQSVGGDYYDYFYFKPNLYLVIADVSGHNTSSAVTMVNFRSQLKAYLSVKQDPAEILSLLNTSLYADLSRHEQFVSCLLVRLNVHTGEFVAANAGHYPPLFLTDHVPLAQSGLVMGINQNEVYQGVAGTLGLNDGLLLYTDGVIESRDQGGGVFGIGRLKDLLQANKQESSKTLVDKIIQTVTAFRTSPKNLDDITVVALKREVL